MSGVLFMFGRVGKPINIKRMALLPIYLIEGLAKRLKSATDVISPLTISKLWR